MVENRIPVTKNNQENLFKPFFLTQKHITAYVMLFIIQMYVRCNIHYNGLIQWKTGTKRTSRQVSSLATS